MRYVSLYKSQTLQHSHMRWSLKRQRLMGITFVSTKTIKLPTGEQTVHLPIIIHCYLLMHWLKDSPVAAVTTMVTGVASVANLMSEAIAPHMGKPVIDAKASIISKLFSHSKVPAKATQSPHQSKKSQPPQRHSSMSSQGKGGGKCQQKKTPKKPPKQRAYEVTFKNSVLSEVTTTSGGERANHGKVSSNPVLSGEQSQNTILLASNTSGI